MDSVLILRIRVLSSYYSTNEIDYLDADRWEQLIVSYMPNLHTFDFQHQHPLYRSLINQPSYRNKINDFNSEFWIEHQWFFEYRYFETTRLSYGLLYSTNPYR